MIIYIFYNLIKMSSKTKLYLYKRYCIPNYVGKYKINFYS